MAVYKQVAMYFLLLLAGFALRYPWRAEPPLQVPGMPPPLLAEAPPTTPAEVAMPEYADTIIPGDAALAADGEYSDAPLPQFAAEPAVIDLLEDQASDPDPEVREEAAAALALGLEVSAEGGPQTP